MCELGATLRGAREAKGLSLKEAARALALKVEVLEALEACRFQDLPEPPLARGYLRRYALFLGLDPEVLLALYPNPPAEPPPPPPRRRVSGLWFFLLLPLSLSALLLGVLSLKPSRKEVVVPHSPGAEVQSRYRLVLRTTPPGARAYLDGFYLGQTPLATPPLEGGERLLRLELAGHEPLERRIELKGDLELDLRLKPLPNPQEGAVERGQPGLVLRLEGRSWLRVTQGEKRLYEGIPEVGTSLSFPLPVEVRAGNPQAVRVILNGRDLGPMGEGAKPLTRRYEAP